MCIQWDPFITDTFGEHSFGRYTEVAFVEGLFCVQTLHLGPVHLAVISQLPFLVYVVQTTMQCCTIDHMEQ